MKKVNSDAKVFVSNSFDETDTNPAPNSPGRLGYRSIPHPVQRPPSRDGESALDPSLPDSRSLVRENSLPEVFQREGSTTSLHSNDSSESLDGSKKNPSNHLQSSPSITSSGYHSDEIHASNSETGIVTVNGNSSPPRVLDVTTLPASPSQTTSSVSSYDASRYQDETSGVATLTSVSVASGFS